MVWRCSNVSSKLIKGYDLSHWNTDKQFTHIINNTGFLILKASQGISFVDKDFMVRVMSAILFGHRVGAYHYLDKRYDARLQAKHFFKTVSPVIELLKAHHNSKDIPFLFFLDFEESSFGEAERFMYEFTLLANYPIHMYTSMSWYKHYNLDRDSRMYWVAGYASQNIVDERIDMYPNIFLYQYSSTVNVEGSPCDCNLWIEERKEWYSRWIEN